MKTHIKTRQFRSLKTKQRLKYALLSIGVTGISFWATGLLVGGMVKSDYSAASATDDIKELAMANAEIYNLTTKSDVTCMSDISENSTEKKSSDLFRIYPNPFKSSFIAEFRSPSEKELQLTISDKNGKQMYGETVFAEEGKNSYCFNAPENFKKGAYVLQLSDGKNVLGKTELVCNKQ